MNFDLPKDMIFYLALNYDLAVVVADIKMKDLSFTLYGRHDPYTFTVRECVPAQYELTNMERTATYATLFDVHERKKQNGVAMIMKVVPLDVPVPDDDCEPKWWIGDGRDHSCELEPLSVFENEIRMAKVMGDEGIGPSVFFTSICRGTVKFDWIKPIEPPNLEGLDDDEIEDALDDYRMHYVIESDAVMQHGMDINFGVIVMEKYDTDLGDYLNMIGEDEDTLSDMAYQMQGKILEKIDKLGYKHRDIHDRNFVVNIRDDRIVDMRLIDFATMEKR